MHDILDAIETSPGVWEVPRRTFSDDFIGFDGTLSDEWVTVGRVSDDTARGMFQTRSSDKYANVEHPQASFWRKPT